VLSADVVKVIVVLSVELVPFDAAKKGAIAEVYLGSPLILLMTSLMMLSMLAAAPMAPATSAGLVGDGVVDGEEDAMAVVVTEIVADALSAATR
jgi:hypothetical protein